MIPRPVRRGLITSTLILACCLPAAWPLLGAHAAQAVLMGYAAGSLSVVSFALLAYMLAAGGNTTPRRAVIACTVVMFVKLPLIAFLCLYALDGGGASRWAFLAGAALVYSALVTFACLDLRSSS
ncbi:MAG TPA: hypothetical protein VKT78_15700 [Fimbriimonadaceae bacterium]|nr:hypothetical protein [Fimbriimonadaceae bacterium]